MLNRAEGLVIRSMDYGEGNKIITVFTKEFGKVSLMVRGAKKLRSRHAAVTQLFTYADFSYFKSSGMGSLNGAEILDAFQPLREELFSSAYASYLAEMCDRMMGDADGSSYIFEQLKGAFQAIQDGKDKAIVAHVFELKMLNFAGYMPVLDACVSCGRGDSDFSFSASMGGTVCSICRAQDTMSIQLSEGALKLLRLLSGLDVRRLGKIDVKDTTKAQLKQALKLYIDHYVGIKWKSRSVLDQLEKYGV